MYRPFFGFARPPFERDLPADQLFRAPALDELHARLCYLAETRGIGVVHSEPGCGKTTALRRFKEALHPDQVRIVYLHDTSVNAADLYRQLALELGIEPHWSRAMTFRAIQQEVVRLAAERRLTVLLIIDEAHRLRADVLAELPLLTNFEWDSGSRLALLLCGQAGLRQRLRMAELEALAPKLAEVHAREQELLTLRAQSVRTLFEAEAPFLQTLSPGQETLFTDATFVLRHRLDPYANPGDFRALVGEVYQAGQFGALSRATFDPNQDFLNIGGLWSEKPEELTGPQFPDARREIILYMVLLEPSLPEAITAELARRPDAGSTPGAPGIDPGPVPGQPPVPAPGAAPQPVQAPPPPPGVAPDPAPAPPVP